MASSDEYGPGYGKLAAAHTNMCS